MAELSIEDAQALAKAIVELSAMAGRVLPVQVTPLTERLRDHFGGADAHTANTSMVLPVIEHANLQLALDSWKSETGVWELIGLAPDIGSYSGISLASLVHGTWFGPGESAVQYVSISVDADETIACIRSGVILTELDGTPAAIMIYVSQHGWPELVVEVVCTRQDTAEGCVQRLRSLIDEHNAFRGKVISFSYGRHGEFGITFARIPRVTRDQVVLRDRDLDAIEEHAIGITDHAAGLVAAGQHVRRGLLLYGPPGTGKTHTVSYLLGSMTGRTTIILSGAAVGAVGQAGTIARQLQPATIVIEDVDLIAMDRSVPGGENNSILFQLLNEMDGLADDADVLFVLTTNRVDILEPALTARPGRVDQAIEIALPDAVARRRLIALYAGSVPSGPDGDRLIERTAGASPAFIKELSRRATLNGLRTARPAQACLHDALDAMHAQSAPILRSTLAGPTVDS